MYVWTENQNRKDSNMIASALLHCLSKVMLDTVLVHPKLRLFSDSWYGQNKHISVLAMLFMLKKDILAQNNIQFFFPVRGHSFLPADRVFGRIEQEIRKVDPIMTPNEYISILKKHGHVHEYNKDYTCFDFKGETDKHCKKARPFKLSEAKVRGINSDQLGLKTKYDGQFQVHSVLKRGRMWSSFSPQQSGDINCVKPAKKGDVLKLLEGIGASDEEKLYYNDALKDVRAGEVTENNEEELFEAENEP